jgi:U11/U12 small nuclear ribonucleoprotein SNRNP48
MSEDIEKKREIFAKTLDKIGITRESLLKQPHLVQCKYNSHHYVPESSLDRHLRTCPYSALKMDKKTIELYLDQLNYKYTDSSGIIGISLDSSTLRAIRDYCRHGNSGGSHDVEHEGQNVVLESNQDVPSDIIQQNDPILLIRYIKSINQVPLKYHMLIPSLYHPILLKTWLISNIPQQHIYKGEIGGEFHLVDDMLYHFTVSPTVTPTAFLHRVHPLISHASRHFTLSFWKFLIIHQIQQHHNISEKLVQDLLPLPNMDVKSSNDKDVSSVIKSMAARIPCEQHVPIPVQHVSMTTNEKRLLYDYVVEVSRKERREANNASAFTNDISSLYNDSIKMTGGNVKGLDGEGKDKLLELKEMRDVKRRRQSYRAKNVHITQKSIKQVMVM